MEHLKRNATQFEVFDVAHAVAQQQGLSLEGEELEQVIEIIKRSVFNGTTNPAMHYGRRTEAMFGYVVAALGEALIVKQEDAGKIISRDANITPPDYRLVLPGKKELLVEVKNVHQKDPNHRYAFKPDYLTSLESYSRIFAAPLKFAIYWSQWNTWTLVAADKLPVQNNKRSISMTEAMKMNEMAVLGDLTIGTKAPLALRLIADPSKSASIAANGEVSFTVGATEMYCAGERIYGAESRLAWYMMLHGRWSGLKHIPLVEDGRLIALDNVISPEMWDTGQDFAFIGDLSGMISDQYKHHTAPAGRLKRIRPSVEPDSFGIVIPENYKSESLPLWRFMLKPNYD